MRFTYFCKIFVPRSEGPPLKIHVHPYSQREIPVEISQKCGQLFNSLPNDKYLDWSKLKAFADD